MTSHAETALPVIKPNGPEPVIAVCCNKCRTVRFTRGAEAAVAQTLAHAEECGSNSMIMAELIAPAGAAG